MSRFSSVYNSIRHGLGTTSGRVGMGLGAIVLGALVTVTIGGHALFNSDRNVDQAIGSGTLTLGLGTTATSSNRLDISTTGLSPGDTMQRAIDIANIGSVDLTSLSLTTIATASSLLDTNTTDGLQLAIDECSQPWTEAGSSPAFTYTCNGSQTARITSRPAIGAGLPIDGAALSGNTTGHYRVTLALPGTAGNTFFNRTSTMQYTFTGVQRSGANR